MKKSTSIFFTSLRPVYIVQSGTLLRPFTSFHVLILILQLETGTSGTWKDVTTSRKVTLLSRVKTCLVYIWDVRTCFFAYACESIKKEVIT